MPQGPWNPDMSNWKEVIDLVFKHDVDNYIAAGWKLIEVRTDLSQHGAQKSYRLGWPKYAGEPVNSEQLLAELDPEQGQDVSQEALSGVDHRSTVEAAKRQLLSARNFRLDESLERMERSYVEAALALTNGNLSQAAKLLGIHRTTLYSRMQSYGAATDRNAPDQ